MAAAAAEAEVDACLVTCGLVATNARRFSSINGIDSIDAFDTLNGGSSSDSRG